jgi:hypothetical protein
VLQQWSTAYHASSLHVLTVDIPMSSL